MAAKTEHRTPEKLVADYGAGELEAAVQEARSRKAKHLLAYAERSLQNKYGERRERALAKEVRKVCCDACELPGNWMDDMTVRDGFAVCRRCAGLLGPVSMRIEPNLHLSQAAQIVGAHGIAKSWPVSVPGRE